jgi:hypothetical protein
MRVQHFFKYLVVATVLFTTCKKDKDSSIVKKEVFSGYAQKGPFVNGSSVTIVELDADLNQTGKTYHTTIADNSGSFEQKNIELVSRYVELKVDGYYFHEIAGVTAGTITLYALADIADVSSVNVNVLTHLEKPRVEYLVKQGKNFTEAKQQAQREIFAIFGFSPPQNSSEALNLVDNAMLIAISCIVESNTAIMGGLTELMADISNDIKTDGVIDVALGKKIINNASTLTTTYNDNTYLWHIRNNLETKYAEMGINVTIPDFESYINAFINSGLYQ